MLRSTVIGGLACSVIIGVSQPSDGGLPAVALGSAELLALERTVALFAGWIVLLVVVVEAWWGRLPLEISGRGVRYAELPAAEARAQVTDSTLERLEAESEVQRIDIANMQGWMRAKEAGWRN